MVYNDLILLAGHFGTVWWGRLQTGKYRFVEVAIKKIIGLFQFVSNLHSTVPQYIELRSSLLLYHYMFLN